MVMDAMPQLRSSFEAPSAIYDSGRVCHVRKRDEASWAVMRRAVEAYRDMGEIEVIIEGKKWRLWLGLNKSPARRKRNAMLRRLEKRATQKGAEQVTVDWWGGHVLSKGLRLATVTEEGDTKFVGNPWLEALGRGADISLQVGLAQ